MAVNEGMGRGGGPDTYVTHDQFRGEEDYIQNSQY